ncbi:MAG TPA: magnesium transporter [Gemmatimonadales bacterium]|nr:magnesium transporter [Gemmatimonadales bacterium]
MPTSQGAMKTGPGRGDGAAAERRAALMEPSALLDAWPILSPEERLEGFELLDVVAASDFFLALATRDQAELLEALGPEKSRPWLRLLAPDDAADVIQALSEEDRERYLALLDPASRQEVTALLAYEEDEAGGLMNTRYMRLRPDVTVEVAIRYLRRQAIRGIELIDYAYVLDQDDRLLGVVSFRRLFGSQPDRLVREVMRTDLVTVTDETDQEAVARLMSEEGLLAVPVVDAEGRMKGLVTADDIVAVVQEEATEDIQKLGGMEALQEPYLEVGFAEMFRKRGGWLAVLFIGEMLTTFAMGYFEQEIARAVVLANFIPLIISSGGNSGSQAATLVIRALGLGELGLRDWWRVMRRELAAGLALGALLGAIGFLRIVAWEAMSGVYGEHAMLIGLTVAVSLLGVVVFGTISGSMLPLLLHRLGLDPASASAPFVATLVDVTGLVIYFSAAAALLRGTLL